MMLAMNRVLPLSMLSSSASSAALASIRSESFHSSASRCAGSMSGHGPCSNAARAAATARSTSAWPASAIDETRFPVAGSMTSSVRPDDGSTHSPADQEPRLALQERGNGGGRARLRGDRHGVHGESSGIGRVARYLAPAVHARLDPR